VVFKTPSIINADTMNKTAPNEWSRVFLIEGLPEPLSPASAHLQIFDNYIENTRMRIRTVRDPSTKTWTRSLQQRFTSEDGMLTKMAEIHLNGEEYALFQQFEGREIRKNRYFHEFDRIMFSFDVYLGALWGLNAAKVEFENRDAMGDFTAPAFAVFEVTGDPFFHGSNLVTRNFDDVQTKLTKTPTAQPAIPDE
jgi:CYTH domain-containing protein